MHVGKSHVQKFDFHVAAKSMTSQNQHQDPSPHMFKQRRLIEPPVDSQRACKHSRVMLAACFLSDVVTSVSHIFQANLGTFLANRATSLLSHTYHCVMERMRARRYLLLSRTRHGITIVGLIIFPLDVIPVPSLTSTLL